MSDVVQSIRSNALVLTAALLALALMLIILLVLSALYKTIAHEAEADLITGSRVFERLLDDRNEQLASHAKLLANDLRFQQAIAKHAMTLNDREIVDWLQLHQENIEADLGILVDSQGRTLPTIDTATLSESLRTELANTKTTDVLTRLTVLNGRPYQIVFAPLPNNNWRAWVGMGFELDGEFLNRARAAAGVHISLLTRQGHTSHWRSTLPRDLLQNDGGSSATYAASTEELIHNLEPAGWQSRRSAFLTSTDGELWSVVSVSVANEYQAFAALRTLLLAAGLLSIILATVVTLWLRRRLDERLQSFASAAQHIAHGDYSKFVPLTGHRRLGWLESAFNKMQRAVEAREHHFSFHARHDPLTGFPNQHYIETCIRAKLSAAIELQPFAMAVLQIRRVTQLKHIYQTRIADGLIMAVATRAQALLAPEDIIGRIEDDQFLLYLDGVNEQQITSLRQQLVNLYRRPCCFEGVEFQMEITVGAILCCHDNADYTDLLRRCKLALAHAHSMNSPFSLYRKGQDDMHLRRAQISHLIPKAARDNEFTLVYQPQLNLKRNTVERVEALLRWPSRELGVLSPSEFIPLAEGSGQIGTITRWLISSVADQLKQWQRDGCSLEVSINISALDLAKEDLIQHLTRSLDAASLNASLLTLEVTESSMIPQSDKAIRNLRRLHERGFKLAMDDFGTGFSSLSQIKALPLQELKIDKAFVLNLDRDREDQCIVSATINMAHTLGLEVVAEGVENAESLGLLHSLRCDGIQGNLLAKPMSCNELRSWLVTVGQGLHQQNGPTPWAWAGRA